VPPDIVSLLLVAWLHVVDCRRRCVHRTGVSRKPEEWGLLLAVDDDLAEVTPKARANALAIAAPAWLVALLLAVLSAFMPVDVVLEMLATLPTPVWASLPDWPVAF
jgi:hypothetical protein